jgi:uncharacterized protein (TIGR02996 family)
MDLAAVVELWTETLDPATSLAAQNLAAKLPPQAWPEGADARQAAWLRQARKPAGREPELMRAFDFVKVKAVHVLERLGAMEKWQPHPVVTRWLVDVFARQTRAPMLDGQRCFRRVFQLLERHLDLDGAAKLRGWLGTHQTRIHASRYGAEFFDAGITRVLAKAQARLGAVRPLTAAERAALEGAGLLVAAPEPPREHTIEALLAAVYDAPWDDGPRQVLGDFLQERDDPRGEFIALDLLPAPTPEQRRRRNALLREHGKSWFPAALHRVVNRDAKYERGFLATGQLVAERTPIELATFRELSLGLHLPDFAHPVFRGIEAWHGVPMLPPDDPRAARLASPVPKPRVARLGLRLSSTFRDDAAAIVGVLAPEGWPALTELSIECQRHDLWNRPNMPAWFDAVAAGLGVRLPRLERLGLADTAIYRRQDGALALAALALPSEITMWLLGTFETPFHAAARARWLRWLAELRAPIAVTERADELRARLPPGAAARVREVAPPEHS